MSVARGALSLVFVSTMTGLEQLGVTANASASAHNLLSVAMREYLGAGPSLTVECTIFQQFCTLRDKEKSSFEL